jgi:hypothetical protein
MIPERSTRFPRSAQQGAPPWILAIFAVESLVGVGVQWGGSVPGMVSAYIDPGSGALFVQIVVSVAFGFLLYLKRVRGFLGRLLPWSRRQDDGASNKTE